jgi:DNA repair photolyase
VLPGLSDGEDQLTEVVEACAAAGAVSINAVALHLRGTVRGHYFDWLAAARPDLVRLHRGRFRGGAYQQDAARERLEGVVRAAAQRCGVMGRDRYRGRLEPPDRAATPVEGPERGAARRGAGHEGPEGGAGKDGQQLSLL